MAAAHALSDLDIRSALSASLRERHCDDDTVIVEELGLCRGKVRVDVAVVNGVLHGFEIKSDRDSLRRLASQIDGYSKVLDRATIVVGERYLTEVQNLVPGWWGVLLVQSGRHAVTFKTIRRGRKNPNRDPRAVVELLWLEKAIALLEERQAAKGVRSKTRREVWDRVCEHFELEEIASRVRSHLKSRVACQGLQQL
jgi:hypothetical protein